MLLSIEGDEASGKTTLAYSAPLPIIGSAFDMGGERALLGGKYQDLFTGLTIERVKYGQKPSGEPYDILVYELPPPINIDTTLVKGAKEMWAYFLPKVVAAIQDQEVKTVVIDTATIARRVRVNAHLQQLQEDAIAKGEVPRRQLLQIEYGNPNDAMRDIYAFAAGQTKNLVLVHHLTDERGDHINSKGEVQQVLTGKRILEGLNGTDRLVDVSIRTTKTSRHTIDGEFKKCGYDLNIEGSKIPDPTWDRIVNRISMAVGERIQFDTRNGVRE